MHPLFQAGEGGARPTSALDLRFDTCGIKEAIRLVRMWHSRLPRVIASNMIRVKTRIFYVATFQGIAYAVTMWTSPSAGALPQAEWLELRRFAIANEAPKNTASRMLSWMVRDIRQRFDHIVNLISYQDMDVHLGTIYRAAGWKATVISRDLRNRGLCFGRCCNMS